MKQNFWMAHNSLAQPREYRIETSLKAKISAYKLAKLAKCERWQAEAWLNSDPQIAEFSDSMARRLAVYSVELYPAYAFSIVPSKWTVKKIMAELKVSPGEFAQILERPVRTVKHWLRRPDTAFTGLQNEDLRKIEIALGEPLSVIPKNHATF